MKRKSIPSPMTFPGGVKRFGARILDTSRHDPYQATGKYREPTHCAACGAVYRVGRWQWAERGASSAAGACPACRRIHDRLPAGRLTLEGPYVVEHDKEIVQIARHQAEQECAEHALHRIMNADRKQFIDCLIGEAVARVKPAMISAAT